MSKPKPVEHVSTEEDFRIFASEFKKESDRAAIVLGAAKLDLALYQLLVAHLLPVTNGRDELLESDSPLGTFSAKINVSFRLGLIDADFARALHLVRKIRNSFAHEVSSASLDSGSHRDRIRELVVPLAGNWALRTIIDDYLDGDEKPGSQLRACIALFSLRLEAAIRDVKRVDNSLAISSTPPEKTE